MDSGTEAWRRENQAWWRKQVLAAVFSGLGAYLKASSSPNPQVRRLRYFQLVMPVLVYLAGGSSMKWRTDAEGRPSATVSCLPTYLLMDGSIAYWLYVRLSTRKERQ